MRRILLIAACVGALLATGCAKRATEPDNDVLSTGSKVVVAGPIRVALRISGSGDTARLEPGTRLTVGHDPGFMEHSEAKVDEMIKETYGDNYRSEKAQETRRKMLGKHFPPDPLAKFREIKVVVESGEYKGKAGTLGRLEVVPAD